MHGAPPEDEARQELFDHYPTILKSLCRAVRCPHAGADLAQETFVRALRYYGRRERPTRTLAWLRAIARNVTREYLRGVYSGAFREADLEDAALARVACDAPEVGDDLSLDRARLMRAIAELDCRDRAALVGFYFERQSCDALARRLGTSRVNVKTRLFRARRRLRARLFKAKGDAL
jgi:RNA polymerase sigma-70 factor (ECF subfamily)